MVGQLSRNQKGEKGTLGQLRVVSSRFALVAGLEIGRQLATEASTGPQQAFPFFLVCTTHARASVFSLRYSAESIRKHKPR
jgi:hypothetical protein